MIIHMLYLVNGREYRIPGPIVNGAWGGGDLGTFWTNLMGGSIDQG